MIVQCWCDVQVSIDRIKGEYSISVNNNIWLHSSSTALYVDDRWYSSNDSSLLLIDTLVFQGDDPDFGNWNETQLIYKLNHGETVTNVSAHIRQWNSISSITFRLNIGTKDLTNNINLNMDQVRTVFPSFKIEQIDTNDYRGYFTFEGVMMGYDEMHAGIWKSSNTVIKSGMEAGPVVLFNLTQHGQNDVIILSPFAQFMATSLSQQDNILQYGVMGSIKTIPANYNHTMILFYSSNGINDALRQYGNIMQRAYNRDKQYRINDITINYLGYYTDGGAYYYYNTESDLNYEETILSVHKKITLPFHYIQLDSWWYYKGLKGGVSQWKSRPDIFPDGLPSLYHQMDNISLAAHNRYWALDTVYSDKYNFAFDNINEMSLPIGNDSFWIDLLSDASQNWGLIMYEQDWLHAQTSKFIPLRTDINLGEQWLMSMGKGAEKAGITIQYCSSYPRHALQALEIPRVTQARVSSDYTSHIVHKGNQWNIGITSMLADALGIAPFKDVFWSTSNEPGSSYKPSAMEPLPDREIVLATLSTGPVSPGDAINYTNIERIMRCCRKDGLILKPDRPITMIDSLIADWAENNGNIQGELYSTQTTINNQTFSIIFASSMQKDYLIYPSMIKGQSGIIWSYENSTDISIFDDTHPLYIPSNKCNSSSFCLWYISPLWQFNDVHHTQYAFMGELNKWTSVSRQRINSIDINFDQGQTAITIKGPPGEIISLTVYHSAYGIRSIPCYISPPTGQALMVIQLFHISCTEIN
ncbi:unnamed protein product [Rotaria sordida]|uniref:Uncharacterized protein n=1 Tax=Rotaria sordida TaxID=392033 RepID=A0A814WKW9_9BILA|nr:unnamed protein product [Rotaria sordida]CAF1478787.1 unnamed protein product [Rotaria sordida]